MEGTDGVGGAGGFMPVPHYGPLEGQRLVVDTVEKTVWWEDDSHAAAHPGQPNNCVVHYDPATQEQVFGGGNQMAGAAGLLEVAQNGGEPTWEAGGGSSNPYHPPKRQRKKGDREQHRAQSQASRIKQEGFDTHYGWLCKHYSQVNGHPFPDRGVGKLFGRVSDPKAPPEPKDYKPRDGWTPAKKKGKSKNSGGSWEALWEAELAEQLAMTSFALAKVESRLQKPAGCKERDLECHKRMGIQTVSQRAALVAADVESVARFLKAVQRHVDCWLHLYNVAPVTTLPLDFDWGAQLVHCAENTILADCPLRVLALGKDQADLVMLDMATQRRIVWALPPATWKPWLDRAIEEKALEYALDATCNRPAGDDGEFVRRCGGTHYKMAHGKLTATDNNAPPAGSPPTKAPSTWIPMTTSAVSWFTSKGDVMGTISIDRRASMTRWAFGEVNEAQSTRNIGKPGDTRPRPEVMTKKQAKAELKDQYVDGNLPNVWVAVSEARNANGGIELTTLELRDLFAELERIEHGDWPGDDDEDDDAIDGEVELHGETEVNHGGLIGACSLLL
jgi:hypothetical protein